MQKIKIGKYINSDITAFVIFLCFWIALLGFTKTAISGIHYQDDHQLITIHKDLESDNISNVIITYVKKDLNIRFRPFYFVHRVVMTKLLGKDIIHWSIYTGLLAILTSFFLYKFIRLLQFTFLESLIFSFLSLVGPHSCIWWRLGPAETTGSFMLSLSLFLLSKSIVSQKHNLYKTFVIISVSLSLLAKESFILFIPAEILLYLFFYKRINKISYLAIIKKNYIFLFILTIMFFLPVIYVFKNIGTDKIGYAGMGNNYFSFDFVKWTIVQFYKNIYSILIVYGFFLIINNEFKRNFKDLSSQSLKFFKDNLFIILIFLAICLSQCVLYFKSGIETRYYIPFVFGFSILTVYLLNALNSNLLVSFYSKLSYFALIILAIIYLNLKVVVPSALAFSAEGLNTKIFIENILKHSDKTDKVLFVIDPSTEYEWGYFLREYFGTELKRDNFNFLQISKDNPTHYQSNLRTMFKDIFNEYLINSEDLVSKKYVCIAVLPLSEEQFSKEYSAFLKSSDYRCERNSSFNVYYLNK